MALSARTQEATAPKHGTPCSIGKVYLHYADRPGETAELNSILYYEGKTQQQVYDTLIEHGELPFRPGFQSINRHRGMGCRCFKEEPFRFCHGCRLDLPSCVCANR